MDNFEESTGFPALWASHQGRLAVYIAAAVPDFHAGQDIIQKVAIVAFRKRGQFNPSQNDFGAWVRGIARYEILHYYRDQARNKLVFDDSTLVKLSEAQETMGSEIEERLILLRKCLGKLRDRARWILTLRYGEDLLPEKIAEILDTSANTISVTLSRIRRTLIECVNKRQGVQEGD